MGWGCYLPSLDSHLQVLCNVEGVIGSGSGALCFLILRELQCALRDLLPPLMHWGEGTPLRCARTSHLCAGGAPLCGVAVPYRCICFHLAAKRRDFFYASFGQLVCPISSAPLPLCTWAWHWWACGGCALIGPIHGWLTYLGGFTCSPWFTSYITLNSRFLCFRSR